MSLAKKQIDSLKKYFRAVNYLSAIQIYLKSNFLLERNLTFDDIKPRLLGHWGTCPGINFLYTNINFFIKRTSQKTVLLIGPGHGLPAIQANVYLDGTLGQKYPQAQHNLDGIEFISKLFSWPYGFPSHASPMTPGVLLEGGELGYALSMAFGVTKFKKDLLVIPFIGDGEAETGPTATSWFLNRFWNPLEDGFIIPIVHVNGYKISGPTIYGRMSLLELKDLFYGYGYDPIFVEYNEFEDIFVKMQQALSRSYEISLSIRSKYAQGSISIPRIPVIILKTPKGWTGIKSYENVKIEDNYLSHQVPLSNAKSDENQLRALEDWLRSYHFEEVFNEEYGFSKDILDILPSDGLKIADVVENELQPMDLISVTNPQDLANYPIHAHQSSMKGIGKYLKELIRSNPKSFAVFSPDETYSNKINEIFLVTKRVNLWPLKSSDEDFATSGNVFEMLSEHALFGMLKGFVMSGRSGVFVSYEAFVQIITSMVDQYIKFLKQSRKVHWRAKLNALNIILTSSGWRQDHNGFTHQNPGFLSNIIEKQDVSVRIYFPVDINTSVILLDKVLYQKNRINVICVGKTEEPVYFDAHSARTALDDGYCIFDDEINTSPDIVIVGIGDYMAKEAWYASQICRFELIKFHIRLVFVIDFYKFQKMLELSPNKFNSIFRAKYLTVWNFHGYPQSLMKILFNSSVSSNSYVNGYIEVGSTTTPFDMLIRNKVSRWNIFLQVLDRLLDLGKISKKHYKKLKFKYEEKFRKHKIFIQKYGYDQDWINIV
ncbi:MAG: phosphoketolase family protein [Candidatus Dojkabacteria bacterium]|nr:phosphoketolase family protein [Candidatus Dojkabacteria bacterium]